MLSWPVSFGLNNCIQCGSFEFRPSLLCGTCEANLESASFNFSVIASDIRGIPCLGLYRWQRDRNRILNRLCLKLKGTRQVRAWKYYAELFLAEWIKVEEISNNAIIVPCPAKEGQKDHAYLFADSLSHLTGLPLVPLLEMIDVKEQKRLSKLDRERRSSSKFRINNLIDEKISLAKPRVIYFVDDIITSGATVRAAQSKLSCLLGSQGFVKAIALIIRE